MRRFLYILAVWSFGVLSVGATDALYLNKGVVTNAQVDAVTFVNQGKFLVESIDIPWQSQNTLNYTNQGIMSGYVGFDLLTITPEGDRLRASSFVNTATGTIESFADLSFFVFFGGGANFVFGTDNSFLMVDADTIVNKGSLRADSTGLIQLTGRSVNLEGGTVLIDQDLNQSLGFGLGLFDQFITATNFIGDPGIFDRAWGLGNNTNVLQSGIAIPGGIFESPFFFVTNRFGLSGNFFCEDFLVLTNPATFVRFDFPTATNATVEIVAVQVPSTNISVDVRFVPFTMTDNGIAQDDFTAATVQLSTLTTNLITLQTNLQSIYVIDETGASTNVNLLTNLVQANGRRPGPVIVTKFTPFSWDFGFSSNFVFSPGLLDDPGFTNLIVTNFYTIYAAEVSDLANPLPFLPDLTSSNNSGRVEIQADQLFLRNARIRGEGLVSIEASDFQGSSKAIIDSPLMNYSLNFTKPQQPLKFQSLSPDLVARFGGNIFTYGCVWTNILVSGDTNIPNTEVHFHLTMVDASQMHTVVPPVVENLKLKGPEAVEMDDRVRVSQSMLIDAPAFTVNGGVNLRKGLTWDPSRFRNLRSLTNNGTILSADSAQVGDSAAAPISNFVNNGSFTAYSHTIFADNFVNTGLIAATNYFELLLTNFCYASVATFTNTDISIGPIELNARQARFDGGSLITDGDITLSGSIFKLNNSVLLTHNPTNIFGGRLVLNVNDTLTDSGAAAGNRWVVGDGFQMSGIKPGGNLLGTWVTSDAGPFRIVDHTWAAEDRGATVTGYQNNVALGRLSISGDTNSVYNFAGAGGKNALYVDLLEINGQQAASLNLLTNTIYLAPNITIYYADVASTNSAITAETVNGLTFGDGKMVWVPSFVGPNTGVDVAFRDGRSIRVNRALRFSTIIDSDADGIANAFDPFPFDPVEVRNVTFSTSGSAMINFFAAPQTSYTIQFTDSLAPSAWRTLTTVENTGDSVKLLAVPDPTAAGAERFYRIVYTP